MSKKRKKSSRSYTSARITHILAVIGTTLLFIIVAAFIALLILFKGPSDTAKKEAVNTFTEMSAMKWVPKMFLPAEEVQSILDASRMVEVEAGTVTNLDLIDTTVSTVSDSQEPIEIQDVTGSSYKGKLMIIRDPSKVFLGTVPEFYEGPGEVVADIISHYPGAVAGVNGGDFVDMGSYSYTAQPLGAIISNGEVVFCAGDYDTPYHLSGFTSDNKFFMGNITINEALNMGVRDAVYTVHETGPFLVMDGEALINEVPDSATYGGGKNPRTAIGQRADGSIILLVVDGRQANSLGATFKDLAYVMLDYGAVNACAMDGGTSSQMVYYGEVINNPYSPTGPRKCPTAWLVYE
ncbi:MAG: phosphodiester glycosidase family protein [Parasporobacterium sp.]|nr:phosphodiester glycosidase family protein [Parasporobacterium sp.]